MSEGTVFSILLLAAFALPAMWPSIRDLVEDIIIGQQAVTRKYQKRDDDEEAGDES